MLYSYVCETVAVYKYPELLWKMSKSRLVYLLKTKGTLVVPEWKSAPFWPLLCSFDRPLLFQDFVKDFCCLPKSRDMFIPDRGSSFVYSNKRSVFS